MPHHAPAARELAAANTFLKDSSLAQSLDELDQTNPHHQDVADKATAYARRIQLNSDTPADQRDPRSLVRAAQALAAAIAAYSAAEQRNRQEGAA